ncbi:MAG: 50S ribosomal protein L6 [Candidatus Melainabacteria bacterium]|nr:50S ribosomal protein L6 [Candidatus Melainabacteria bacterium]
MSRIGKAPIDVPDSVEVSIDGQCIQVKGPLGTLKRTLRPEITLSKDGKTLSILRVNNDRLSRSLHGLSRTLVANMVTGVHSGFSKNLEIIGVGYRAQVQGRVLTLQLGYSHPVEIQIPEEIQLAVESNTKISIKGPDKQQVGDLAAYIRSKRPPEPYKGKGVRYAGEKVRRKAGKAGKK